MQALKQGRQRKVIQKRLIRRERFARIARIRHRKEKNVFLAIAQDIDHIPKYAPQPGIYESLLGLIISETNEGVDQEISFLNSRYLSNSITVQNGHSRILSVKMHKKENHNYPLHDQKLDEWENSREPFLVDIAKRMKSFKSSYGPFIEKNKEKFQAKKLDKETLKAQQVYLDKRDELMAKKACMEVRSRFDEQGSSVSELNFNSKFVNSLSYDFEEFIQRVLVEGIPRVRPEIARSQRKHPFSCHDIEYLFNTGFVGSYPDSLFLDKNLNYKKMDYDFYGKGYFIKNAGEFSFLIVINSSQSISEGDTFVRPMYRLYIEQQMAHEAERKYFLDKYYKGYITDMMIKSEEDTIETEPTANKVEEKLEEETSQETKEEIKEELYMKNEIDFSPNMIKEEINLTVPDIDYLNQIVPHLQKMKNMFAKRQNVLNQLLQLNVKSYLAK